MMGSLLLSAGALQAATPETIAAHTIAAGTEEHWTADKVYTLTGAVVVQGRLTIDAGTTILAEEGFDKYILVDRGGQIFAEGTATAPITFKADRDDAPSSYWGGLILNGRAPIAGGGEGSTEIDPSFLYGGSDAADNSGVITYVKLLHTGAKSNRDVEHNGLTLNAVGNGTRIENLYIANGGDDAIEFFGGTVNVSNLLAVDCEDDCFDFTQGYRGKLTNAYAYWSEDFTTDEGDPRGIEADGNLDGNYPEQNGQSDFTVENVTFENLSTADVSDGLRKNAWDDIIKARRGTKLTLINGLAIGNSSAGNAVDMTDSKGDGLASSVINLTNNLNLTGDAINGTADVTLSTGNTGCPTSALAWTGFFTATGSERIEAHTIAAGTEEHWTADKVYTLAGAVIVQGRLTIDAGTTILAEEGFDKYILVDRGGQIFAEGTATAPITFKADRDDAPSSYWGGLILNGRAPIAGGGEGSTEIDPSFLYGGSDAADNSGVITYVKLLHTGAKSNRDVEHNGLTLNAVGNGTRIENLYIANGGDDAIEFFGGTVNVSNLLAVDCEDDCFDFTQGYRGKLTNAYAYWSEDFTTDEGDPRGIEADGNLDGNYPEQNGQSDFTVENVTFENLSTADVSDGLRKNAWDDIIKARRGTKLTLINGLAIGNSSAGNAVDMTDSKGDGLASSVINLTNNLNLTGDAINGTADVTLSAGNTGCNYDLFSWVAERPVSTAIDDVIAERPESQDKAYYDLMGRRYERPTQPGIYIHQGKKVVVK